MKNQFVKKLIPLAVLMMLGNGAMGVMMSANAQTPTSPVTPGAPVGSAVGSGVNVNVNVNAPGQPKVTMAQPGGAPVSVQLNGQVPVPGGANSTAPGAIPTIGLAVDSGPSNLENNRTKKVIELEKLRLKLDFRKLEKEIEKLDEPTKAEVPPGGVAPTSGSTVPYNPFTLPPEIQAQITAGKKALEAPPEAIVPETKVYSIYGFEASLLAKMAVGSQGGYVVAKGDTLPDGRLIADIKPNYVLISTGSGKKAKQERIFLSEPPVAGASSSGALPISGGNMGSSNINPATGLGSMPGGGVFTPSTTRLPSMNVLNVVTPTATPGVPRK